MSSVLYLVLLSIHILVSFGMILIVLLQAGKGAGLSSAFGVGGGESFFGGRGPMMFLEKLTTACAVVFMITCLSLSLFASKQRSGSVVDKIPVQQSAPAVPTQSQSAPAPVNVPPTAPVQAPTAPATPTPTPNK